MFQGVDEEIYCSKNGADLATSLNQAEPWLLCSLVHKFGRQGGENSDDQAADSYLVELTKNLPKDFSAKGNVFVDECHRTQSGKLHTAMKAILPNAIFAKRNFCWFYWHALT